MKFFIHNPNPTYFTKIEYLFTKSLIDIGLQKSSDDDADIIFCINYPNKPLDISKYRILIQVEDVKAKSIPWEVPYHLYNEAWGFDITNLKEKYIYLGYHPFLDLTSEKYETTKGIGFLGSKQARRGELWDKSTNKFDFICEWNYLEAIRKLREYNINIHIHYFDRTEFTPWDRMVKSLCNKICFMSEICYIPPKLDIPLFTYDNFDKHIEPFIKDTNLCRENAEKVYNVWKKEFDMRDQLKVLLKGII